MIPPDAHYPIERAFAHDETICNAFILSHLALHKLTVPQLARELGLDARVVWRWARSKRPLPLSVRRLFALWVRTRPYVVLSELVSGIDPQAATYLHDVLYALLEASVALSKHVGPRVPGALIASTTRQIAALTAHLSTDHGGPSLSLD